MIRTKICGITQLDDALCAIDCGACALGFNFYEKSQRYIEPKKAESIIKKVPPFVSLVGLFVNEQTEIIKRIVSQTGVDTIQLHGDESTDICQELEKLKIIKAFRIKSESDLTQLKKYNVMAYLLDSYHPKLYGGTGIPFEWNFLDGLNISKPIIIAGGLKPENIDVLLNAIVPYGIDVCSGVEISPGIKDHKLMKLLFDKINNIQNQRK